MGRSRRDCPVPGCESKDLLRLPSHLLQVHNLDSVQRSTWLSSGVSVKSDKVKSDIVPAKGWWETKSLIPFEPCSSMTVSGPTGVGKTLWVYRLLKHLEAMYVKEPPKKIMYCYGVYQALYDDMERTLTQLTLHQGLPSQTVIDEFADGQHGLIVLDDLMQQVLEQRDMELLFTQGCHHRRLSVIFITQNLFGQGRSARTITLNTWYLIVFKNVRDSSQLLTLGRQLFPGKSGILVDSYRDVMKDPYAYLVIDIAPHSEDKYRLRTRVFPGEDPILYIPKSL
jgi:hypothetical protein